MTRFTLHVDWPPGVFAEDQSCVELNADTVDLARLQAAIVYAEAEFRNERPSGFSIRDGEIEVYRYPEPATH